jgi:hypothetical protein
MVVVFYSLWVDPASTGLKEGGNAERGLSHPTPDPDFLGMATSLEEIAPV